MRIQLNNARFLAVDDVSNADTLADRRVLENKESLQNKALCTCADGGSKPVRHGVNPN